MEYEVLEIGGHEHLLGIVDDKIADAVASVATPGGSVAFASLPNPSADVLGHVYDVTDAFATDARFVDGPGKAYPAGTNVWVVNAGTESVPSYKYDIFAGMVPEATAASSGLMSAADKSKLNGVEANANAYVLPTMSSDTKGGAMVGAGLRMDGDALVATHDMGLTGAGVGQVAVVAAVDANGVPTSWGVASMASRVLTVTVTTHDAQTVTGQTVTVREGDGTGEVVAQGTYAGTPMAFTLPVGLHYHVSVTDALRMYGPPSVATGTIGMSDAGVTLKYAALASVLERDSQTGEYTNASVTEYLRRTRTGLVYGVTEPLSAATALTKTGANAGMANPVGGYIGTPAVDPYDDLGPFLYRIANGYVDADGVPHLTAIEGIDDAFARDGSNGDVWQVHGIIYERWAVTATDNAHDITDTPATGFAPYPKCHLPDGTLRPYMITAAYPLGTYNNAPASVSGVAPRTRDVSHNAGITICDTANTGYSLKSTYDDWYVKTMFEMKHATKHSQGVYAGCTNYNLQYNPSVAETGVRRVILTNARAANLLVGSNCQFGTRVGASSNDRNAAQNFDVFDNVTITSIEPYDADNSAINFDTAGTFDSATTCLLSTAPWDCGCLDAIVGDGTLSVAGRTNGKEPFKLQGIELAHGMYEVLGDVVISNDGTDGWTPYVCADTRNAATSVTANYAACDDALPANASDGWKYPAHTVYSNGLRYGADASATSSSGLCDGTYTNKLVTTGTREWLGLGHLNNGANAGLWYVNGNNTLGIGGWGVGSRLSGTGRAAA